MPSRSAKYEVIADTPSLVVLKDVGPWGEFPTVTNDAENVVRTLAPRLGLRRLVYVDSEGDLAELVVEKGKFAGFRPL